MSKKLNIIEASNMPIGTEFRVKFQSGNFEEDNIKLTTNEYGEVFQWGDKATPKPYKDLINATFIPIQQPVNFMKAINSGKRIKCVHRRFGPTDEYLTISEIFKSMSTSSLNDFIPTLVNEGKWYIEEREDLEDERLS